MLKRILVLVLAVVAFTTTCRSAKLNVADSLLLSRVFTFASQVDTTGMYGTEFHAYKRFLFSCDRRNILLMLVPKMYGMAHAGARKFAGEYYDRVRMGHGRIEDSDQLLEVNTLPHGRKALSTLLQYLNPQLYEETILDNYLLSPFCRKNKRFYRYKMIHLDNQRTRIVVKAKVNNTQLVSGRADIETSTGRIISTTLYGERDMIRFRISFEMGTEGVAVLYPRRCVLKSRFSFLGSKITADYFCLYGMMKDLPVSAPDDSVRELMTSVRPEPLPTVEQSVLNDYYLKQEQQMAVSEVDSLKSAKHKKNLAKTIFWDILGEHMFNRMKSHFGSDDQGYLRINPIFNPLYFGYSDRKGLVYKFDIRAGYSFTPNRDITIRFKSGYSFKQNQFFYNIPFRFNYNKRRHAHIAIDINHGRRIYSSEIKSEIVDTHLQDSILDLGMRLDYFRDTYINIYNNYDISDQWSFNAGFTHHKREAVYPEAFKMAGRRSAYRTTAPRLEVQYRPLGWHGPALTFDYERGIKGFLGSQSGYERWEIDGSYIHVLPRLQALSMRLGGGVFTRKSDHQYFLDFTNFRDDNIPGGWNDDWTGEFKLIRSQWYNSSRYYVRMNTTYESPLLITSRIPFFGHFVEMERFYAGAVIAQQLHPYIELGYGLTTRWVSFAAFSGWRNGHFERLGGRIGIELFRKW